MRNIQMGFVAGDMNNPTRDLPRIISTAMSVAIAGFMLMNAALFTVLPFTEIRERSTVAVVSCFADCIQLASPECLTLISGLWREDTRTQRARLCFSRLRFMLRVTECKYIHGIQTLCCSEPTPVLAEHIE